MRQKYLSILLASLMAAGSTGLQSCSSDSSAANTPEVKETKTGLASYYSRAFQGEETASGETFDNKKFMAAHPSYPMGTILRVTNMENGDTVRVRVNDRGPTDKNVGEGVIIDLSQAAAKKLGMMQDGRVKVKVEVMEWGNDERK